MENNPRKSKALIIAIITIILLLIIGFLVYKNRDRFGEKTSGTITKIFSPLVPSVNSKNLKSIDENSEKVVAQAGEDIKAGDNLTLAGKDANNNPIVVKAGRNSNIYGFAGHDFLNGELGEVYIYNGGTNNFWNTFSNFLNNLFENEPNVPSGGWNFDNNLGIWIFDPNGFGGWVFDPSVGGWVPPGGSGSYNPQCSDTIDNDGDGQVDINDPNCHVGGTLAGAYLPNHYSESSNPLGGGGFDFTPQCSDTIDNEGDGQVDINDPNCHVGGTLDGAYLPNHYSESSNPLGGGGFDFTPQCSDTRDNDNDGQVDINDPNCHVGGTLDGAYLPNHYSESSNPLGGWEPIRQCSDETDNDLDGLIDEADPTCHVGGTLEGVYLPNHNSEVDPACANGANNPPLCTIFEEEKIPDLTAGMVSPTSVLSGAQTTISAPISNIGEGSTITNFSSFFNVTNQNMGETELGENNNIISKSKFNKILSKIFKKETWISIVKAATTGNAGVIINVELAVVTPKIDAGQTRLITTSYNFNIPGTYYVRVCADKSSINSTGVIVETNEDNNCGPWTAINSTSSLPPPGELPQCSDNIDNDRDQLIDDLDSGCHLDGDLTKAYIPSHNNESRAPSALSECNDSIDNDGDNLIDINDPACHLGGDITKDYIAEHDSELTPPVDPNTQIKENLCLAVQQNPLVFTDQEKSELAELLRKFYLLAPNLKTEDDISIVYDEIERYKEFIGDLTTLTNQCYAQGISREGWINPKWSATVPWETINGVSQNPAMHRFENPWYKMKDKNSTQLYFDLNLIDTKIVSGYFSGTTNYWRNSNSVEKSIPAGLDCDEYFTPRPSSGYEHYYPKFIPEVVVLGANPNDFRWADQCKNYTYPPLPIDPNLPPGTNLNVCFTEAILAGCKWNAGTFYHETERLLNIW